MNPRIIKTKKQHQHFLAEITSLAEADPSPESEEGIRLDLLLKLIEDYETPRFVIDKPDPIDAIEFRMEQQGLQQKDLAPLLGGKNRVSEILARKRPLTLKMIRALHEEFAIPLESLIREPRLELHKPKQPETA